MTWWNRFKKWLWWRTCPTMTIVVRCGKKKEDRFATTKQFIFHRRPANVLTFYCEYKFDKDYEVNFGDKTLSKAEIRGAIDKITAAEGSEPAEMQEWRDDPDFDPDFKPRKVPVE